MTESCRLQRIPSPLLAQSCALLEKEYETIGSIFTLLLDRTLGRPSGKSALRKGTATLTPWCRFLVLTKVGVDFSATSQIGSPGVLPTSPAHTAMHLAVAPIKTPLCKAWSPPGRIVYTV
jgi:hypothetical protein